MIGLNHYLTVGTLLLCIGIYGALTRRNAIGILMSIELIFNAANVNFIAFSKYLTQTLTGQIFAIFVITIAAAEAAVGLAIILNIYRRLQVIEVEKINILKW